MGMGMCLNCKHCDPTRTNNIDQVRCKLFHTYVNPSDRCDHYSFKKEPVRCIECIHYGLDKEKGGFCMRSGSPSMWRDDVTPLRPDDFCSYGERRCDCGK